MPSTPNSSLPDDGVAEPKAEQQKPRKGLLTSRRSAAAKAAIKKDRATHRVVQRDFIRPALKAERAEKRAERKAANAPPAAPPAAPSTGLYQAAGDAWIYEVLPDGSYRAHDGEAWRVIDPDRDPAAYEAVTTQIEDGTLTNVLKM